MEKNRENLNNPNQDLPQDLNSILGLDTQLNTNNLIIRPMRKEDIEGVHMVEVDCFDDPWSKKSLMDELKNNLARYLVAELDSVEGIKGGSVLLTIHFVLPKLQLAFLREANDSKSVTDIFDHLYELLGFDNFTKLFPICLADNGT